MKNYNLDKENYYCVSESEYNKMLVVIDEIKADSDFMSNIHMYANDFGGLMYELLKRPADDAKRRGDDVDDYIERLIGLIQYVEMLESVIENKEFIPFTFPKSFIDESKKKFLEHFEYLERNVINV